MSESGSFDKTRTGFASGILNSIYNITIRLLVALQYSTNKQLFLFGCRVDRG